MSELPKTAREAKVFVGWITCKPDTDTTVKAIRSVNQCCATQSEAQSKASGSYPEVRWAASNGRLYETREASPDVACAFCLRYMTEKEYMAAWRRSGERVKALADRGETARRAAEIRWSKRGNRKGWLYVARSADGFLKLGFSINPRARIYSLVNTNDTACPPGWETNKPEITPALIKPARSDEITFHHLLKAYRAPQSVEWYRDCPEVRKLLHARRFVPFETYFPAGKRGRPRLTKEKQK